MPPSTLLKLLVPDAPPHKRTERDVYPSRDAALRVKAAPRLDETPIEPGLQAPHLTSSYAGSIDAVLLAFPGYGVADADLASGYRSVIQALRPGTEFVVVHARSSRTVIEPWFAAAGHASDNVTFVPLADYVSFTDWAEDGYLSLTDANDGTRYLMEPWEFPRAGDALIADAVEEYTGTHAAQAPLIFQGGNCLVGDDFWLLGKDYFADSAELVAGRRPPVAAPGATTAEAFVRQLFADYVDSTRRLLLVGTAKPIPLRSFYGTRRGAEYFLDIAGDGVGTFQPIFHIDMFLTLIGRDGAGDFEVLVGSPALGNALTGEQTPFGLDDVYDTIAENLVSSGFKVRRNPLVHWPTRGRQLPLAELRQAAAQSGNEELGPAVDELVAAGATPRTRVAVRSWHHVTWNNCLVERSERVGKHVYLPTFGGGRPSLEPIDRAMQALWQELGFAVHPLGDFNRFAERQGVVHCIKKYLRRGR